MLTFNYNIEGNQRQYTCSNYYEFDKNWFLSAEINTRNFVQNFVKPNFTIIDAGAQIGMYTILFSKLAHQGKVYAFEPTDTVEFLKSNLAENGCDNVEIINKPLSSHVETKTDKIFKIWSKQVIDEKEYEFETIDNYVKSNNLKVDLLKIDVDSYDYEVLLGSENTLREQSPYVIVELNHALGKRGYTKEQGIEFLKSLGYRQEYHYDEDNFLFIKG
jgi:FkbM family methyltransferase